MKTFSARPEDLVGRRKWYVIDAAGKPLGRVASEVASILRGKHKPIFTPHVDTGDHVIVVNASQVVLTGRKADQKMYYRHTGRPGSLKATSYRELREKRPEILMRRAVKGMLPHNPLGRKILKKLHVYGGSEHRHEAQQPERWPGR